MVVCLRLTDSLFALGVTFRARAANRKSGSLVPIFSAIATPRHCKSPHSSGGPAVLLLLAAALDLLGAGRSVLPRWFVASRVSKVLVSGRVWPGRFFFDSVFIAS